MLALNQSKAFVLESHAALVGRLSAAADKHWNIPSNLDHFMILRDIRARVCLNDVGAKFHRLTTWFCEHQFPIKEDFNLKCSEASLPHLLGNNQISANLLARYKPFCSLRNEIYGPFATRNGDRAQGSAGERPAAVPGDSSH